MNGHVHSVLSDFLDGGLVQEERREVEAHLAVCPECRSLLAELQSVVKQAKSLESRRPGKDLWPAVLGRIEATAQSEPTRSNELRAHARPTSSRRGAVFSLAAALVLGIGLAWWFVSNEPAGTGVTHRFLMALHETDASRPNEPERIRVMVAHYAKWAEALAREGKLDAGAKLADEVGRKVTAHGVELAPKLLEIGGYFVLRASSFEEASRIAATCPHLEYGGWIELRQIGKL